MRFCVLEDESGYAKGKRMDRELLSVAGGTKPADVVITGGRIVNVYTGEIYDGGVAISNQTIAAVGDVDYCIGEGTRTIDAEGAFITPGFIFGKNGQDYIRISLCAKPELLDKAFAKIEKAKDRIL